MRYIASLLIVFLLTFSFSPVKAGVVEPEVLKQVEPLVNQVLNAYNNQDFEAFYKDFASSMSAIATKQAFDTLYKNMYFSQYGKLESKTLIEDDTVLMSSMPTCLVVYKGIFEKKKALKFPLTLPKKMANGKLCRLVLLRCKKIFIRFLFNSGAQTFEPLLLFPGNWTE